MVKIKDQADRYRYIIGWFEEKMPVVQTELNYRNPYELLVAVILSAQCTDKRVNQITPEFFKQFPTAGLLTESSVELVFELIKSCSYPNNKAKHLLAMAQTLMNQFDGDIPSTVDDLQKLPGVGRKTANVIASVVFNKPAMAVDTHVFRVAERLGLTINAKNPLQAEQQLVANIPEVLIAKAHHWLILHGRYICKARKPDCENCGLKTYCKYFENSSFVAKQTTTKKV